MKISKSKILTILTTIFLGSLGFSMAQTDMTDCVDNYNGSIINSEFCCPNYSIGACECGLNEISIIDNSVWHSCKTCGEIQDQIELAGSNPIINQVQVTTYQALYDAYCVEEEDSDTVEITSAAGIECTQEQMILGQCKFKIYDTLGIRQKDKDVSVGIFVQDIVLSATMFIGTVVVIAMVVSGLMFVLAGANSGLKEKAMKGLINAFIGLLLVMGSYTIIRLVQFIVKGN